MPFWRKGKKINRTFKKLFPLFSLSCHRNAECSEGSIPEKDSNYAKARCKHWKRRSKSPSWPQAERWTHQQQNVILKKSSPLLRNWLKAAPLKLSHQSSGRKQTLVIPKLSSYSLATSETFIFISYHLLVLLLSSKG